MPACLTGYYRYKINTTEYTSPGDGRISVIEYWYSIHDHNNAHKPDGWLRITEGREKATEQVEKFLRRATHCTLQHHQETTMSDDAYAVAYVNLNNELKIETTEACSPIEAIANVLLLLTGAQEMVTWYRELCNKLSELGAPNILKAVEEAFYDADQLIAVKRVI